ncbi:unnamed protein product [Menidia menidia]|uniref:(Atlantic silverside) hypothetical protein n=1 Tax=Menidia menidia TaxID=238744 RepID=A0A8S4BNL1_9TELE|nr:unnamed protein product [Menidia menidia]
MENRGHFLHVKPPKNLLLLPERGTQPTETVIADWAPCTWRVPLQPEGLGPVVVGRGFLRQELDRLAEKLKSGVQIPGLRGRNPPPLQLPHSPQQLPIITNLWSLLRSEGLSEDFC